MPESSDAIAHRAADCRADPDAPAGMHGTRCARMRKALREAVAAEREWLDDLVAHQMAHLEDQSAYYAVRDAIRARGQDQAVA